MTYAFFFGSNSDLSKLELLSVLKVENINYEINFLQNNFFVISLDKKLPENFILYLGGTIRILELFYESDFCDEKYVSRVSLPKIDKFNYSLTFIGTEEYEEQILKDSIRSTLVDKGKKAQLKSANSKTLISSGRYYQGKLDEGFELLLIKSDYRFLFFQTIQASSSQYYKSLDENRPSRKFTHGTSFRLAKILINLLCLKKGTKIFDPFCGTGTFLVQGLASGFHVEGIDNDSELVEIAQENLLWAEGFIDNKMSHHVRVGDAQESKFNADGVVFEPFMGPFLTKTLSVSQAKSEIAKLNELYSLVFKNISRNLKPGSPIVCILPGYLTREKNVIFTDDAVFLDNNFILKDLKSELNYTTLKNKIDYESKGGSKILRKVYILERV